MPSDGVGARPVVIEFVGTPGAGKTTLARMLVALLNERGVAAATIVGAARDGAGRTRVGRGLVGIAPRRSRRALLWAMFYVGAWIQALAFAAAAPALTRVVVTSQLRRRLPGRIKGHILFWFFQLGGRHRWLTRAGRGPAALVVDDGFLHRCVHLSASHADAPDPRWIDEYVDLVPRPDLVIHAGADPDLCLERVRARGVWRHSRALTDAELDRYVAHAAEAVALAVGRARAAGWNVRTIDNGARDLAEVRRELAAGLDSLTGERAA